MTPCSKYRLLRNLKFEAFYGDQRLKQGLINMLQMKVYNYCKTSNRLRIQKSVSKNQKPTTLYPFARGDHKKTIKVIEVLACLMCHGCWYIQRKCDAS